MFRTSLNTFMLVALHNSVTPSQAFTLINVPADLSDGNFGFSIDGRFSSDRSGFSTATGDVNGDGFQDLIIGAPASFAPTLPGSVSVIFGPFSKEIDLRVNGSLFLGEIPGDNFGYSVTSGDFNCDGIDDVGIGAPFAGQGSAGRAYIIFGSLSFANQTFNVSNLGASGIVFEGASGNDSAGYSVKMSAKKPGICSTLLIGAPFASPNTTRVGSGAAYIVRRYNETAVLPLLPVKLSTLNGTIGTDDVIQGTRMSGAFAGDKSGYSGEVGDFNGDGRDDFVIGASEASRVLTDLGGMATQVGAVSVVFGGNSFGPTVDLLSYLDGVKGFSVYGRAPFDWTGSSVAMGKVKPGSCSALLIGAPKANLGTQNDVGSGLLLHCTNQSLGTIFEASVIDGINGVIFYGENTNGQSSKVRFLPDMDGDGVQEIAIGAPSASKTYIIFGDYLNKSTSPTLTLSTPNINALIISGTVTENSGVSVIGVENITGAGVNAVLVGADSASPIITRGSTGSSCVVYADNIQWENNKLNVSAGENHTFTTYDLNVSVPHHSQYTNYNITAALYGHFENKTQPGTEITFFGQPDLENGNVIFICDKDSKLAPSYKVTASHTWAKTPTSAANVSFNSQPLQVVFNRLDAVRGKTTQVTPSMLAANDPDNPQHNPQIVVTIFNRSNGFFSPGDSFTLGDVSSQRVSFTHDGSSDSPNYGVNFSFGGVSIGPSFPVINFTEPAITGNPQTTTVANPDDDSVGVRVGASVGTSIFALILTLGAYFYKRHLDRKEFKKKREAVLKENATEKTELNQEWQKARAPLIREILDGVNMVGCCGSVNENDISAHIRAVETLLLKLQTEGVEMDPPLKKDQREAVTRARSLEEQQKKEQEFKTINRKYVENVIVTEVLKSAQTFIETKSVCCPCLPGCKPVLKASELDVLSNKYLVQAIQRRLTGSSPTTGEDVELEVLEEGKNGSESQALESRAGAAISALAQRADSTQDPVETNNVLSFVRTSSKSSFSETTPADAPKPVIKRVGSKQSLG